MYIYINKSVKKIVTKMVHYHAQTILTNFPHKKKKKIIIIYVEYFKYIKKTTKAKRHYSTWYN